MNENLLNELVLKAGIDYLSDLHDVYHYRRICYALSRLSPDNYSLEEWEMTVAYILGGKEKKFTDPFSACRFLKAELQKTGFTEGI